MLLVLAIAGKCNALLIKNIKYKEARRTWTWDKDEEPNEADTIKI